MNRRHALHPILFAATLLGMGLNVAAEASGERTYPRQPVTIVVPFPAGGTTDVLARIVAEELRARLGGTFIVENRGGGGSAIGTAHVARSEKDGHTLLLTSASTFTAVPHLMKNIGYAVVDFEPLSVIARSPFAFVVRKGLPAKNLAEFVAYAKANPGKLNNATNGASTTTHILGELTARVLGVELHQVHYRGAAPAMKDLLSEVVDTSVDAVTTTSPLVGDGQIRAIATLGRERPPQLPDVPTFRELGYDGLEHDVWFGVLAPQGTPQDIVVKLNQTLNDISASPTFRKRAADLGMVTSSDSLPAVKAYVLKDIESWGNIIRTLDLKTN